MGWVAWRQKWERGWSSCSDRSTGGTGTATTRNWSGIRLDYGKRPRGYPSAGEKKSVADPGIPTAHTSVGSLKNENPSTSFFDRHLRQESKAAKRGRLRSFGSLTEARLLSPARAGH